MKEIFEIGDNITILRDGQVVKTMPLSETDEQTMIALMVGRQVTQYYYKAEAPKDSPVVLSVKNLTRKGVFQNVSFDLHQGEVLGVSGLIGAGRTEVMRAIFGADRFTSGEIEVFGQKAAFKTLARNLSGGNQQKVVIAKWLAAKVRILIMDEPTRGIDVNAKAEIYALMKEFVENGGSIIMVSSELPEVLGVSNRIMVMRGGVVTKIMNAEGATEKEVMQYASFNSETETGV